MGATRTLLLMLCVLGPAASAQAECAPKKDARTLAENRVARVVQVRTRESRYGDMRTVVWGCLRSGSRWQRITRMEPNGFYVDAIRRLRLVGPRLAYVWERGDPRQDISMGVHVYDIRERRRTTDVGTAMWPTIERLVLSRTGAVAYSVNEYEFAGEAGTPPNQHRRIYRARGKRKRLLDDGPQVRLSTLKLRGTRLTWLHGDQTRRATLR